MGRKPCCLKEGVNRGAWTLQEDEILTNYIQLHGEGKWRSLPQKAGLKRCGKSCRLRWMNYLRPGIKRGNISPDEEDLIIRLHRLLGNRWSLIAGRLPGRTDNEIKNYWNSVLSKKLNRYSPKRLKKQCECEELSRELPVQKYRKSGSSSNVIAPKPTRCTKILVSSLDQGNDELMSESRKGEVKLPMLEDKPLIDNALNMGNALDYLDFLQTPMEHIFENSSMLEIDLGPMLETGFENVTSLLELEEEEYWRDLV